MSEVTDMTKEELLSSLDEHIKVVVFRYKDVLESYENLDEDYKRLQSRYNELKEDNEKLKQQGKEFSGYIELNSYGEGIKKGEQLMQEKANKIIEFYRDNNNDIYVLQKVFSLNTIFDDQILEDIEGAYNKIIEYEKEKEQEIHIGDVVEDIGGVRTLLVTNVANPYVYTLDKDGRNSARNKKDVVKTGEHYPLDKFLKELK